MTPQEIYDEAVEAAKTGMAKGVLTHDINGGMCGATWIVIRPATGAFVRFLKSKGIGQRGTYGGWEISNPVRFDTQNVDLKMISTRAFADSLRANGILATAYERLT
jgi:hypothetical protein